MQSIASLFEGCILIKYPNGMLSYVGGVNARLDMSIHSIKINHETFVHLAGQLNILSDFEVDISHSFIILLEYEKVASYF